jgi:uncharacterized YigZ family protein
MESEDEFQEQLHQIKSEFPDATHHCWAWRLNPVQPKQFSSDDGEPSGTAGLPILNQLKSADIINGGIVVVRYYGGTKLGKSGLIEAYSRAAALSVESADLVSIEPVYLFRIQYPYPQENTIQKLQNDYDLQVQDAEYLINVSLKVACPASLADSFKNEISGLDYLDIEYDDLGESFV